MPSIRSEIRSGAYYDSAVLMQLQRGLLGLPGVLDSGAVMGTAANLDLLAQSGLLTDEAKKAGVNDLLIVVKAETDSAAVEALGQVDGLLAKRRLAAAEEFRPKSLETAARQLPEAGWVLVSVPGRFAAGVAREALDLGKHVFLYSDNVSLEDEVALKKTARERGLLVMGPDCGTAIINGVGLGFANYVRRGPIGVVGASGTGTQAVTVRIHELGSGLSHAIGTGGRDLKSEVGAITMHQGLHLLARDPDTKVIVLISKPPAATVATKLLAAAQAAGKPVVVDFIGYPPPARKLGNLHFATSLSEAAELAVAMLEDWRIGELENSPITNLYLRGLFSGGTLAYEAALGLQAVLSPLYSNSPISDSQILPDPLKSQAHTIIDLGDEVFMVGRLHPMIDNDLRLRRLKQEAADPEVGLILLDVVLGEGAHPDPASELAPAIAEVRGVGNRGIEVVVMVIGTDSDPQNVESQVERLRAEGAVVFRNATEAVGYVAGRMSRPPDSAGLPVALETLSQPMAAINVGLDSFYASLVGQGARAVHVDWRPPAGGNEKLAAILARMKKK
jgi:FdrA protein